MTEPCGKDGTQRNGDSRLEWGCKNAAAARGDSLWHRGLCCMDGLIIDPAICGCLDAFEGGFVTTAVTSVFN